MRSSPSPPRGDAELTPPPAPEAALAVEQLAKAYGPTVALRSCSLAVRRGEIHAVVGENGSGKSTLVKILSGVVRPDAGEIALAGRRRTGFRSPREPLATGVATVFQEVLAVGAQSVLANVWLGFDGLLRRQLPDAVKRARAEATLAELLGEAPPLDLPVETLGLGVRQACGIARALLRQPALLILDESTSALDVAVRDRLFAILRRLAADGRSVIFISHRMDEIRLLADRVTVLRAGDSIATLPREQATADHIVRLMSGDEQATADAPVAARDARPRGDLVLRAAVRLRRGAEPVELDLHAGEIVGLAGLEGHGQEAFLHALRAGAHAGEVARVDGPRATVISSAAQAARHGVAYVARDRRGESIFPTLSIRENFGAPTLADDRRRGLVRGALTDARLGAYRSRLAIRLGASALPITTLSGGNQQKVVLARWLAAEPAVLLLNDPTRGVDLASKRDIYAVLRELADQGVAIAMLSTEVDEQLELMDRVLVFREGAAAATLSRGELSRSALVARFFGGERGDG